MKVSKVGSGVGSESVSKRYGSPDLYLHQNVTDPQYGKSMYGNSSTTAELKVPYFYVSSATCGSGSGSGLDPDSIGSVDPDPGGQKWPTK
jgi:hypothetical protein